MVTDLAPLGFTLQAAQDGGFDISPSGNAYAALTSADFVTRLYAITLPTAVVATPAATDIGQIGLGNFEVRALAILDDDRDSDGVLTSADNCATSSNADQANIDGDTQGDVCDDDDDGDGVADPADNCPIAANGDQADQDSDGGGDVCDGDRDGDGIADSSDLCPSTAGANQADLDADGQGDDCDADDDGDGVPDAAEAALGSNPRLSDSDGDGKPDQVDACVAQAGSAAERLPPGDRAGHGADIQRVEFPADNPPEEAAQTRRLVPGRAERGGLLPGRAGGPHEERPPRGRRGARSRRGEAAAGCRIAPHAPARAEVAARPAARRHEAACARHGDGLARAYGCRHPEAAGPPLTPR